MIARLLGHVNGLTILIAAVLAVLAVAGLWAFLTGWVMDRPEPRHAAARDEQDTLAFLMAIKYGPAWGALAIKDRLMFLRAIIAAAGGTFQASPAAQAPTKGGRSGKGSAGACLESRPAARADMTGSLTPRPEMEDPGPLARGGPGYASPAGPGIPAPSPSVADGAAREGAPAAAGSVPAPQALPPLPPDELGPECSYQDGPSFTDWLRDDIAMEAAT